ncbi:endolytic transglycosylase MltG [Cellulomonas sp. URHD0024]|uniref:endolytic transglycosylase MltG n=1 Tax=Cellulomonas sp. URHD0024 TaxID=1302620 RepID=UPI001E5535DA|nr:endolytic transglycosylase MltG [Cellulomonas sp. URHD0024]
MTTDLFGGDPHDAPDPRRSSRSRGRAKEQRERKRRRRRSVGVLVVALVMVLGAGYVVFELMGGFFDGGPSTTGSVKDYPGPGHGSVKVVVAPGQSGGQIATTLVDAGVVASTGSFVDAFAENPAAATIQPGTYKLLLEMKSSDAIVALLEPASRVSFKVTVPEGLNKDQTIAKISEKTLIKVDDLKAAIADPASIGLPAEAGGNIEGWLFPATYDVQPGATAASVLSQLTSQTVKHLQAAGVPQDQWETVIIKASIIEREVKLDDDRYKVARAIENRLERAIPLQIDSTTSYYLGKTSAPTAAENHDASNPYSTYEHVGLPPGPISSPGADSINAVMHPADGPWIFWVTVNPDSGETLFTTSNDEQNANIQKLRDWNAAHGK